MIKPEAIANILNDDSFKTALTDLTKLNMDILINSDIDDKDVREIAYIKVKVINEIMSHLQSIADDSKIKHNNTRDR